MRLVDISYEWSGYGNHFANYNELKNHCQGECKPSKKFEIGIKIQTL